MPSTDSQLMSEIIAPIPSDQYFDIEEAVDRQLGAKPLDFPNMDKAGAAICEYYLLSTGQLVGNLAPIADRFRRHGIDVTGCPRGDMCPFRHVKGDRTVVCKHWLRGLCKKGDDCEFLHEYDMSKMPECYFYSKFGQCMNKECLFLHLDPQTKMKDCPWYDRGFCRHGPNCKNRHVRRKLCINYLAGFCPKGKECEDMHARFELPTVQNADIQSGSSTGIRKIAFVCDYCKETGHKASNCFKLSPEERMKYASIRRYGQPAQMGQPVPYSTPLHEITCFKCSTKGHYANRCPKSFANQAWNSGV
ncbi:hypothetical protein ACOME3_003442 [Neoechinorhynchus agilis]